MNTPALLVPVNGPAVPLDLGPTEETAYQAIRAGLDGGWFEAVHVTPSVIAYVDEEGVLKNLPGNPAASRVAGRPLVGPVVFVGHNGSPDTIGLASEDYNRIAASIG